MAHNRKRRKSGVMTVEFAVTGPLLILMMVGAADLSRMFFHAITVAGASGTGSFWGAQNTIKAISDDKITAIAEEDAVNLTDVTVTPELYCDCPTGSSGGTMVPCSDLQCASGYGMPRVYAKTIVEQTFEVVLPWPGVPNPVVVNRETFTRVQ